MAHDGFSRRHFFYGALLAGAVPAGGFGSTPSLKHLGYKSPNEKLNIAAIGAGGKGASDIAGCSEENIVAMADPDSKGPEVEPKEAPVPSTLDWDAWLGDSEPRPYSPAYAPHNWRAFPEFGCGAIGDMACHILGTPNMALRLANPISVEARKIEGKAKY